MLWMLYPQDSILIAGLNEPENDISIPRYIYMRLNYFYFVVAYGKIIVISGPLIEYHDFSFSSVDW